jgi:hypothetical protein
MCYEPSFGKKLVGDQLVFEKTNRQSTMVNR